MTVNANLLVRETSYQSNDTKNTIRIRDIFHFYWTNKFKRYSGYNIATQRVNDTLYVTTHARIAKTCRKKKL